MSWSAYPGRFSALDLTDLRDLGGDYVWPITVRVVADVVIFERAPVRRVELTLREGAVVYRSTEERDPTEFVDANYAQLRERVRREVTELRRLRGLPEVEGFDARLLELVGRAEIAPWRAGLAPVPIHGLAAELPDERGMHRILVVAGRVRYDGPGLDRTRLLELRAHLEAAEDDVARRHATFRSRIDPECVHEALRAFGDLAETLVLPNAEQADEFAAAVTNTDAFCGFDWKSDPEWIRARLTELARWRGVPLAEPPGGRTLRTIAASVAKQLPTSHVLCELNANSDSHTFGILDAAAVPRLDVFRERGGLPFVAVRRGRTPSPSTATPAKASTKSTTEAATASDHAPGHPYTDGRRYEVGEKLTHPKFGAGKVAAVDEDRGTISVHFDDGSSRDLRARR